MYVYVCVNNPWLNGDATRDKRRWRRRPEQSHHGGSRALRRSLPCLIHDWRSARTSQWLRAANPALWCIATPTKTHYLRPRYLLGAPDPSTIIRSTRSLSTTKSTTLTHVSFNNVHPTLGHAPPHHHRVSGFFFDKHSTSLHTRAACVVLCSSGLFTSVVRNTVLQRKRCGKSLSQPTYKLTERNNTILPEPSCKTE